MPRQRLAPCEEVLSIVERGWRGARECSLALNAMAIPVTHLVKGSVSHELQAMIRPYPHIRLMSAARPLFRVRLWWVVISRTFRSRLRWILLDNDRTLHQLAWWCRLFRLTSVSIQESDEGYQLWVKGQPVALSYLCGPRR